LLLSYKPLNSAEQYSLRRTQSDSQQQKVLRGIFVEPLIKLITKLLLHPFNGLFSRTTWVNWYQKGKTSLDLPVNEARDDGVLGWQ